MVNIWTFSLILKNNVLFSFENWRQRGAAVIDNLEIANIDVIMDPFQSGELVAMVTEFKVSINKYLKELTSSPVSSLAEIISFNSDNPDLVSNNGSFACSKLFDMEINITSG